MQLIVATLLICNVGGPGTAQQAQPVVEKFLRHLEDKGGWPRGSLRGLYTTDAARCNELFAKERPSLVVSDLGTYLARRVAWKLTPVARMGRADALVYHLLVRDGVLRKLPDVRGKAILTPLAHDPRFVARVVLGGKLGEASLELKPVKQPLQALRKLARGQADAALVDGAAYRYLGELELPAKLVSLHRSPGMPQLTLALAGKTGAKERAPLLRALPALCDGAGAELCKTFGISSFSRANKARYRRFEARYGR